MTKKFLILFIVYSSSFIVANGQLKQGEIAIGGKGNDYGNSVIQTKNGNYVIGGTYNYFGDTSNNGMYIVNLDISGNVKWAKAIGGTLANWGIDLIEANDGGYVMTGWVIGYGAGNEDVYIVKVDSIGNLLWTRTVGLFGGDFGESIVQTSDNGYLIAGLCDTMGGGGKVYLIKLDSLGTMLWTKYIGGYFTDAANSIIQTKDKGFIMAGYSYSFGAGNGDVYIIKLDSGYNISWTETIGGPKIDEGETIIQTKDDGYALAGFTASFGTDTDVYVIKLDSTGKIQWTKTIGGTSGDNEGESIIQDNDGGYVIAGYTTSYGVGGADVYAIKLDSIGNLKWTKTIGGSGNDYGGSVIKTKDGGYAIVGYTDSYGAGGYDVYFIKLDSTGGFCSTTGNAGIVGSGGSITSIDSGRVSTAGRSSKGGSIHNDDTITDICLVTSVQEISAVPFINMYPNPFTTETTIDFGADGRYYMEVDDIMGRKIEWLESDQRQYVLMRNNLTAGIYLLKIYDSDRHFIATLKLVAL